MDEGKCWAHIIGENILKGMNLCVIVLCNLLIGFRIIKDFTVDQDCNIGMKKYLSDERINVVKTVMTMVSFFFNIALCDRGKG